MSDAREKKEEKRRKEKRNRIIMGRAELRGKCVHSGNVIHEIDLDYQYASFDQSKKNMWAS